MKFTLPLILFLCSSASFAACNKDQAKASVEKICSIIESKGDGAVEEIKTYRYCGTNYVWVQDSDVKMVIHPIKGRLNGKSLKRNKDKKGKHLFVEFDKQAKANASGAWVDYYWTMPGEEAPTPKVSFVKLCGGGKGWIVGSGVWK